MAERFEDLRVWQTAREFTRRVYELSNEGSFESDWALKKQIRRTAISVMSNVAEGFESRTRSLFIDHLGRAKASAGEVRSQLYIAQDQGYVNGETFEEAYDLEEKISGQLYHRIRHLKEDTNSNRVRELPTEYLSR